MDNSIGCVMVLNPRFLAKCRNIIYKVKSITIVYVIELHLYDIL